MDKLINEIEAEKEHMSKTFQALISIKLGFLLLKTIN